MGTRPERMAHSGRGIDRAKRRTHFGHGIQRKKGLSLQPPDSAAGKGLNHSTLAAVPSWATIGRARLNPSGLSRAKGRTPRFLGRETLEKPDNDLSITPHFAVYKGFGASAPKVFTLVHKTSGVLQQKFDFPLYGRQSGYFRHRPTVSTRRTHLSSSRLARAL